MYDNSQRFDRVQVLQQTPDQSKFTDPNRQTETEEYEYIYEEEEEEDNPDGSLSQQPNQYGIRVEVPLSQEVEQTQIEPFIMESTPIEKFEGFQMQRKPN